MLTFVKTSLFAAMLALVVSPLLAEEGEWISMFDGKTFDGWKKNENPDSFKIEDGAIVANGPRSHLFYVGQDKPFKDFEFQAEVMTMPKANAGVYFHTKYQAEDWPKYGYEAQVNATHGDPIKTGSIYQTADVKKAPHEDEKWFTYNIKVEGKKVTVSVDGEKVNEYVEPEGKEAGERFTRVLDQGTFALQAHDPVSVVKFRNLKVRRLNE